MEKKKAKAKWWQVLLLTALILCAVFSIADLMDVVNDSGRGDPAADQTAEPTPMPIIVSAADLLAAYDKNEVAADNQYKDNVLSVTGVVGNIGKDILDEVFVTLGTGEAYKLVSVQCYFSDEKEIGRTANLEPGDTITIVGICGGKSLNTILKDCYIL